MLGSDLRTGGNLQQLLRATQAVLPQENPNKGSTRWRPSTSPPWETRIFDPDLENMLKIPLVSEETLLPIVSTSQIPRKPRSSCLDPQSLAHPAQCSCLRLHPRIMRKKTTRAPWDYKGQDGSPFFIKGQSEPILWARSSAPFQLGNETRESLLLGSGTWSCHWKRVMLSIFGLVPSGENINTDSSINHRGIWFYLKFSMHLQNYHVSSITGLPETSVNVDLLHCSQLWIK